MKVSWFSIFHYSAISVVYSFLSSKVSSKYNLVRNFLFLNKIELTSSECFDWLYITEVANKQWKPFINFLTVRPSPFNMNILTLPISYFSVVFLICIQPSKPFVALMCSKCWCQWLPWFKAIIFSSQLSSAHNFFHLLRIKFKLNAAEISYESTHFLHILIWKKNLN